ncbi:putative 50S ribosomal protein L4 [Cardiosporidium cionae]|uniref:Large ribosomal subunit protein uL4m n=1 Tax=Cardiosporidium cionae TaxID=476202 RepID=A0ABQ7JFS1_9APIC|nr:putative 50S ribosomal protein L4 [Cardiosporidium cionae]|eukprot:KAF8822872.1 putative 50S ribosomal protein L4 [Cardiosporidium cionae]
MRWAPPCFSLLKTSQKLKNGEIACSVHFLANSRDPSPILLPFLSSAQTPHNLGRLYQNPLSQCRFHKTAATVQSIPAIRVPTLNDSPVIRRPGDIVNVATVIRNWWAFPAVGFNSILEILVYPFDKQMESDASLPSKEDMLVLPNAIFGLPLRPDILYLCYRFHRRAIAGYSERMQLFKWEWPGSSKKVRSQVRSGKSRMGWRKAPGKYYGVKAHPLRPFDARIKISKRTLWQGLKIMLSTKFAQNQMTVVDNFIVSSHKTKYTVDSLRRILGPRCNSALLVHAGDNDVNDNFRWAVAHIAAVRRQSVEELNTYTLLKFRQLVITEKALQKLLMEIYNYPETQGWTTKNATPDGLPAPKPTKVPGWNADWIKEKEREKAATFDREMLKEYIAKWKWTSSLKGPLKVPRNDPIKRFKLFDYSPHGIERPMNIMENIYEDSEEIGSTLSMSDFVETQKALLEQIESLEKDSSDILEDPLQVSNLQLYQHQFRR